MPMQTAEAARQTETLIAPAGIAPAGPPPAAGAGPGAGSPMVSPMLVQGTVALCAAAIVVAGLYVGRELLVPLVLAILLAFVPIYLANVAFSKRFGAAEDSRSAFGLNLLGAMLGGTMEYLALLTGYRNLLLLVAALYLIAFLLAPRKGLVSV